MKLLVLISLIAVVQCGPMIQNDSVMRSLPGNLLECHNSDFFTCFKEKALKVTERLRTVRKLNIFEGVTLINNEPRQARSLEPLPTEGEARSLAVNQRLWDSMSSILESSELELTYSPDDDDDEESRSLDNGVVEGRDKKKKAIKKKLKLLLPLLIIAKIKAAAITVVAVVIMAASLFKLASIAKIAFIVKIIGIIKALLAKKHVQQESWEVPHGWETPHVEHPPHIEHAHGWEGGWSRKAEANNLAYSGYNQ